MKVFIFLSLFLLLSCDSKKNSKHDSCLYFCDINYLSETSIEVFEPLFKPGIKGAMDENSYAKSPLQTSILSENFSISTFLIEKKEFLNLQTPSGGFSPLMLSVIVLFFDRFSSPAYVRDRVFSNTARVFHRLKRNPEVDLSLKDLRGNSSEIYIELGKHLSQFPSSAKLNPTSGSERENAQKKLEDHFIAVSSLSNEEKKKCWFLCNFEFMQSAPIEHIIAEIRNTENLEEILNHTDKKKTHYSLPLIHALNRPEVVELLFEHGARIDALDIALPKKNPVIIKAIQMYISLRMMEIYQDYDFFLKKTIIHSLTKKLPENFLANLKKSLDLMIEKIDWEDQKRNLKKEREEREKKKEYNKKKKEQSKEEKRAEEKKMEEENRKREEEEEKRQKPIRDENNIKLKLYIDLYQTINQIK